MSASPSDNIFSAVSGMFILLDVINGIDNSFFIFFVTQVKAALGTEVAIVGILDSCQPIPVFIIVAPAFSISFPSCTTSSHELPCSTKSSIDNLYMMIKSLPKASLVCFTNSIGKRILLA